MFPTHCFQQNDFLLPTMFSNPSRAVSKKSSANALNLVKSQIRRLVKGLIFWSYNCPNNEVKCGPLKCRIFTYGWASTRVNMSELCRITWVDTFSQCINSWPNNKFLGPARVAQWWACRTHDLVVVSSIPGWGHFSFPAYFRLSPLQKHVTKVVGGFGKKSCVSTGVRKPGKTYASPTAMIWP